MADQENYVYGQKVEVQKNTKSLGEFFLGRLEAHGTKVAQIFEHDGKVDTLKFNEILHKGKVAAGLFKKHGLKPRDTVMSVTGNTLEYAPILWGALFSAAAIAPVNPLYDLSDMLHLLTSIQPQIIVSNEAAVSVVKQAMAQYDTPVVFMTSTELEKYITEHPDVSDFVLGKVEEPDTEVCCVLCTTGSSGKPKCVEISHTTLIRQLDLDYLKSPERDSDQPVSVNIAGPFGVAGSLVNFLSLNTCFKCVLVPIESFEDVAFLKILDKYKVNFVVIGPCQLITLAKCATGGNYDLSNLRQTLVGGSPVSLSMFELAKTNLKIAITPVFGMTECVGVCNPAYNKTDKQGTVGVLANNVVAKITDVETGKAVGRRKEGEVCIKAPYAMLGYRNNPEATKAAFDADGFIHTGDVGFFDEDGYLYIVDRIKELIKYRNVHVPATDIEEVLLRHPKVCEAAVIGVYNEVDWEHATAFIVPQPGVTVTEEEIVKFVQDNLPKLKWLHGGVRIVDSIIKSLNGKFHKRVLRAQYGGFPVDKPSTAPANS